MTHAIIQADAVAFLREQPADSLDLVFGSPPYEQARLYLEDGKNMGISRKTDAWVAWMVEVYQAASVACRGLVAFVVAGQTRKFRWSAGPALLMAELHRAGLNLRNPPIFSRVGIPGSGGPDWLRADYEWIICTTRPGKLPWSENTACGHPPKWAPGGAMSNCNVEGVRKNDRGYSGMTNAKRKVAVRLRIKGGSPKDSIANAVEKGWAPPQKKRGIGRATRGYTADGDIQTLNGYDPPPMANPGNIIEALVGGGVMGNPLCHENEAPFPEKLASFFVLSFCRPGGVVCDPFSGSGTTAAMAKQHGRSFIGCDLRASQVELGRRRLATVTTELFANVEDV
jgi:DNA methylase